MWFQKCEVVLFATFLFCWTVELQSRWFSTYWNTEPNAPYVSVSPFFGDDDCNAAMCRSCSNITEITYAAETIYSAIRDHRGGEASGTQSTTPVLPVVNRKKDEKIQCKSTKEGNKNRVLRRFRWIMRRPLTRQWFPRVRYSPYVTIHEPMTYGS